MSLSGWSDTVYVEHAAATAINNLSAASIAMWWQTTSSTARQTPLVKGSLLLIELREDLATPTLQGFRDGVTTDSAAFANLASFGAYATNKWLFVVFTYDGVAAGNNKLYVGDIDTSAAEPSAYTTQTAHSGGLGDDSASPIRVGRHGTTGSRQFVGPIASLWVFNKVLSTAEVIALQWGHNIARDALVRYTEYGFNGATAAQPDWSGNAGPGAVTGTPTVDVHAPKRQPFGSARRQSYIVAAAGAQGFHGALLGGVRNVQLGMLN